MNFRQLQYAVLLSQQLNFSQVAEQLGISQPALSKQIIALEQEAGVRLFDRSTVPLSLTAAGERFIEDAKELLFREDQLKRSMEEFKSGEKGRLKIGVSPFRCQYLMGPIVKQLRERFPNLQVVLHEAGSAQLHKGAVEGQFDFAIVNLPVDEALLDVIKLSPEQLVLAVPNELTYLIDNTRHVSGDPYATVDLADCEKLPFIVLSKQQELRQLFDKLCVTAGLRSEITAEVVGISTAWNMARSGVGATVLPLPFLQKEQLDNRLTYYSLNQTSSMRQPAVIVRKNQYVSEYARYAIELLKNI